MIKWVGNWTLQLLIELLLIGNNITINCFDRYLLVETQECLIFIVKQQINMYSVLKLS